MRQRISKIYGIINNLEKEYTIYYSKYAKKTFRAVSVLYEDAYEEF